jgi:hypothetical protein
MSDILATADVITNKLWIVSALKICSLKKLFKFTLNNHFRTFIEIYNKKPTKAIKSVFQLCIISD